MIQSISPEITIKHGKYPNQINRQISSSKIKISLKNTHNPCPEFLYKHEECKNSWLFSNQTRGMKNTQNPLNNNNKTTKQNTLQAKSFSNRKEGERA